MNNSVTKYKKVFGKTATTISISILVFIILILAGIFIFVCSLSVGEPINFPAVFEVLETGEIIYETEEIIILPDKLTKICALCTIGLISVFFFSSLFGILKGVFEARKHVYRENKYIKKTNPYIYYRELPNNYGIGITTLLLDSTIENYKDVVAVILDLCARKYLKLVKVNYRYIITVLKGIDTNLLNNEKYIMALILDNNLKNIDYQLWFKHCKEDGEKLGLFYYKVHYYQGKRKSFSDEKLMRNTRIIKLIISAIVSIVVFFVTNSTDGLGTAIFRCVVSFFGSYIALFFPFYIIILILLFINMGRNSVKINYENEMKNNLSRTKKGVEELHKIYSFKAFLSDFGRFVDKNAEEVVLWDRYLSYAQVFGLTNQILKSGYQQLVNNSSFIIDGFDNINFENIDVQNQPEV